MLAAILIFMVLGLASTGFTIFWSIRHVRSKEITKKDQQTFWLINGLVIGLGAVFYMLMFAFIGMANVGSAMLAYEWFLVYFASFLAFGALNLGISAFILRYYKKGFEPKMKLMINMFYYASIVLCIIGAVLLLEGFTKHLTYPLVNGIIFNATVWARPGGESPHIAFYAIAILLGVALCYIVSDHKMYVQYGKHGLLDSTLIAGVVPGIIGARLWWCIAEGQMANFFNFRDGGLAVQGGVLLGALCGILWFIWRRPKYNIFVVIDIVIPTILLAQAVGRWGNFFNQEVYGMAVAADNWFMRLLPTWIRENMFINGAYRLPFFLIESCLNFLGYFFVGFLFKKLLKRWWKPADGALGYLVWYGIVRIIMEPLRDPAFVMGENIRVSVLMSALFIGFGVGGIIFNHLFRYFYGKKKAERLASFNYKSVIFDFDGTLANSDNMLFNSFRILYARYKPGEELTFEKSQTFSGPPIEETLKNEFPDKDIEVLLKEYRQISLARSSDVYLYPNVKDAIKRLYRYGVRLALLTNKEHDGVIKQLKDKKIERYFELILGGEDVENPKPAPDGINKIIETMDLERTSTLFVGDSRYDYLASEAAGVDNVIVSWSPRLEESWSPKYILRDFNEMEMIVRGKEEIV